MLPENALPDSVSAGSRDSNSSTTAGSSPTETGGCVSTRSPWNSLQPRRQPIHRLLHVAAHQTPTPSAAFLYMPSISRTSSSSPPPPSGGPTAPPYASGAATPAELQPRRPAQGTRTRPPAPQRHGPAFVPFTPRTTVRLPPYSSERTSAPSRSTVTPPSRSDTARPAPFHRPLHASGGTNPTARRPAPSPSRPATDVHAPRCPRPPTTCTAATQSSRATQDRHSAAAARTPPRPTSSRRQVVVSPHPAFVQVLNQAAATTARPPVAPSTWAAASVPFSRPPRTTVRLKRSPAAVSRIGTRSSELCRHSKAAPSLLRPLSTPPRRRI